MAPPTPSSSPTGPNPYAIWLRARSAITSVSYPDRISYTIAITGLDGSTPRVDHYRASCDAGKGTIRVLPISEEQLARPASDPRGMNVRLSAGLYGAAVVIPVGRPEPQADLMGVPLLTPTYAFGLRYRPLPDIAPDTASKLRVIATVSTQTADYRVALLDEPTIDGTQTYHLRLVPQRRPKDNRLRELWVGSTDYLPRRALISGNFTVRPLVDVPWTIDFSVTDGVPYVVRERADATLYLEHRRIVNDAVIAFDDIHEPTGIYDEPLVTPQEDDTTLVEPPM